MDVEVDGRLVDVNEMVDEVFDGLMTLKSVSLLLSFSILSLCLLRNVRIVCRSWSSRRDEF